METILGGLFGGMLLFGLVMLGVGIAALVSYLIPYQQIKTAKKTTQPISSQ